jgi:protein-disulfide isomerase
MGLTLLLERIALTMVMAAAAFPVIAQDAAVPPLDQATMRLVMREAAWHPDSTFKVSRNERGQTPSGSYRVVGVDRQCESNFLSGTQTLIVDEVTKIGWIGNVAQLPFRQSGMALSGLGRFLEDFLPEALKVNLRLKSRVEWGSGPQKSGALIPFWLMIDSGYGEYPKQAAVTADGEYLVLGNGHPLDQDPVVYRRRLLAESDLVMWDHGEDASAKVEIVEFSDLECPACRRRWPLVKNVLEDHGKQVRHGMVSTPLTSMHPWAFRAASASWCVAQQSAPSLMPLKELFYSLQPEMEVALVKPTAIDFVNGNGLDDEAFLGCFLQKPSLDAVHEQLAMGQDLLVVATPTFFINGWKVQVPNDDWFRDMIKRLIAGEDLL